MRILHHSTGRALALSLLVWSLPACGSTPEPAVDDPAGLTPATSTSLDARGDRIEIPMGPAFREIAILEDRRSLGEVVDGTPRLIVLLRDQDPAVRRRAALALGRLAHPRYGRVVTDALGRALEDGDADVRREAAFALGQRKDPNAAASLLAYLQHPDAELRARVVEAAGKLEGSDLHRELLVALKDEDANVRIEAADATASWSRDEASAEDVDRALLDALIPRDAQGLPGSPDATAPELRWRILHALARRRAPSGRGVFLERLESNAPLDRLFAAMGLGRIAAGPDAETGVADEAATAALVALVNGADARPQESDWRVATEACRALGALGDAAALPALERAASFKSHHVRAAAMEALAELRADDEDVLKLLRRGQLDLSRAVRAAALTALVARVDDEQGLELVRRMAASDDFVERGIAAQAAGAIDTPASTELLRELVVDAVPFVATNAMGALGSHDLARVRPFLRASLAHPDNAIRQAAASALAADPTEADAPALIEAYRTSTGDGSAEVAFTTLRALAKSGVPLARAIHMEAARDPRPYVRFVASEGLASAFGQLAPAYDGPDALPLGEVPLPGRDYPRWTHNPLAEVVTSKGRMVFELLPAEAPVHVYNFLELAQTRAYDGLHFHRVVSDFVIQGGDERGDGNGADPVRGDALRGEFTRRSYRRGALGMPRHEDPDSGGSQFFVTHRPTPHLDGRYTLFGLLREGGEVLDALELGDRILRVRLLQ